MGFAIKLTPVRNVHRYEHRIGAVERSSIERHGKSIADQKANATFQPNKARQVFRDLAELRGQIDAGDATTETLREPTVRTADPTPDIEQMTGRPHGNERRHVFCRLKPTAVKVIIWRECFNGWMGRIRTVRLQCGLEPPEQPALRVVINDPRLRITHRTLLNAIDRQAFGGAAFCIGPL